MSNKNFSSLESLVNEFFLINKYRLNIISIYNGLNFFKKLLYKNKIIMILVDSKYVGYVYFERFSIDTIFINDLYIKDEFLEIVNLNSIKIFKDKVLFYQTFEDDLTKKILINNKFTKSETTMLLKYDLNTKIKIKHDKNISFRQFRIDKDEKLRCEIQNDIFNYNGREPINIRDIMYEEKQDYYRSDRCVFILLDNKEIGYAQIIYNKGMYMLVNFGILEEYRGLGYGEILLEYMINLAYDIKLSQLYIRVNDSNYKALNLYKKIGFKFLGYYNTFIKS
ncbi:GNAT family N-acetyltransferase [Clostridium sp.]|uniref:GNAT family N-acetyltransferase n=1 Tax=Clostridium sp. TaxID=1506 RepID=UPI002A915909|nr:GNAT family N-acetyltransferase [Clostridium sp.]MDY6012059.1 GNAT family N-acetyltransferase [Clostridium sp.]